MRISDWSSDVCSSDLAHLVVMGLPGRHIMPFQPCSCRQLLGKGGLARTGAAQHECHMPGAAHRFAGKMVGTAIDARRAATAAAISVKARTIRSVMRRPPWFIMDRAAASPRGDSHVLSQMKALVTCRREPKVSSARREDRKSTRLN